MFYIRKVYSMAGKKLWFIHAFNWLWGKVIEDFVSSFVSNDDYLDKGRGIVIMKDGKIVAGASSYTRYNEGIEIELKLSRRRTISQKL